MSTTTSILKRHSYLALSNGALEANPSASYSDNGYASYWQQNLYDKLPIDQIESDLQRGAGRELDSKLRAAHSSSALAINVFGSWRLEPLDLQLEGFLSPHRLRFEVACPTRLRGTPPHLDVLLEGQTVLAIESKCTEWMAPKAAAFSPAYDSLREPYGRTSWFGLLQSLRSESTRFRYLDAAQLIKHALGLMTCYPESEVRLLYAYWEPENWFEWPECHHHRAEIDCFCRAVSGSTIEFCAISYTELLAKLMPHLTHDHARYVATRYQRVVSTALLK